MTLRTNYDSSIEEDRRFSKATPSGEMKVDISNPLAIAMLKAGSFVYVDIVAED